MSSIFGSPVIGAVLRDRGDGARRSHAARRPPARALAAGVGSLVFIGLGSFSGFSTAAWSLSPFPLPPFGGPGWGDFAWTILLAVVDRRRRLRDHGARPLGEARWSTSARSSSRSQPDSPSAASRSPSPRRPNKSPDAVLFSGQESFGTLFGQAATISLSTLALLILFKGLAWSISLGNFRGGPTFPAIFLGVVAGLIAQHLPGYAETQAVAVLVGAACVSVLRLPLASVMIASLLSAKAGLAVAPLIVVAVAVAYLDERDADRVRRRPSRR